MIRAPFTYNQRLLSYLDLPLTWASLALMDEREYKDELSRYENVEIRFECKLYGYQTCITEEVARSYILRRFYIR